MKSLQVVGVLLVLYSHVYAQTDETPVVLTTLGQIQGTLDQTVLGKRIYTFLGVPYAKPPVGALRFEAPQPVEGWEGTWPATESSSVCLQHMLNYNTTDLIVGEEDCLYVNIYTPTVSSIARLPVVVFVHGGAFMYGNGNMFTPHFILDRGQFVYVSVNYRLGPLGFLSTEDEVVPGNNGLKDQVMALKWVQENIAAFGGDKDEVTIAGISAGGASVHLHYLSPQSRGLFKRGISMSGTAYCPWVLTERSMGKAKQLANSVGCPTSNTREMIKCLKLRPGRKILSQLKSLFWPWLTQPFSPFGVVVEQEGDKPFLHEHPYKLLTSGKVADLPWLTSVTSDEGLYPSAAFVDREELMYQLNDQWNRIAPHLLDYNHTVLPENLNNVSQLIRDFYLGNEEISIYTRENIVKMVGDRLFVADIERSVRQQAAVTKSPVYFYEFAYQGKCSISVFISRYNSTLGVSHADDLIYLLSRPVLSPLTTDQDRAMMLKMTNIWVSFIITGKPTVGVNVMWEPVNVHRDTNDDFTYLLINSNTDIRLVSSTELGNRKFWDSLKFDELQNKFSRNVL